MQINQCGWGGKEKQCKELQKNIHPLCFPNRNWMSRSDPSRPGLYCCTDRRRSKKRVYSRAGGEDSNNIPSWQSAPPRLASLRSSVASVWVLAEPDGEMCGWRHRQGRDDAVPGANLHIHELIGWIGDEWAGPQPKVRPLLCSQSHSLSVSICFLLTFIQTCLLAWNIQCILLQLEATAMDINSYMNSINQ